ncbi:MAG: UDP-N-acetylmuramoyl-tripeptide--D-alanyl-D-alanine ligase [Oscillospiraceae bacterium]|nr:UDP-N-acetylmuramoyl-tripeptide--D-alanyl-D-alanine ligase [Oscillospiraceae bacterium]
MGLLAEKQNLEMSANAIADILSVTLQNHHQGTYSISGFSTDTRTIEKGNCFIALKGETFNGNLYAEQAAEKGAVLCILSEEPAGNLSVPYVIVEDTVTAYGKIAHAYLLERKKQGLKVIGITGSSGKTTVKDMTAHVLSAKYRTYATSGNHNNHIGVPYTLLHMPEDTEYAVIEMGMNHKGEISYLTKIAEPDFAIITNVGTAHIGNLGSQENILRAKLEILDGMQNGTLLIPAEDIMLHNAKAEIEKQTAVQFSSRTNAADAGLFAEGITETAEHTEFCLRFQNQAADVKLPMTGLHNVSDALLAVQAGLACGMTLEECAAALADFTPGHMRSERVIIGNHMLIRDYYNANPEAMAAALTAFSVVAEDRAKIAVLGNMNELGAFAADRHCKLGDMCRSSADAAFFCGENYVDFARGYGEGACAYREQSDLINALLSYVDVHADQPMCFLIKASRGIHMEHVYEALEQKLK